MKKKLINGISYDREMVHKIWMTMRLIVFLFFVSLIHVSASVYSQKTRLNIKVENATLQEVFNAIQTQSEFDFFYKNEQIPSDTRVTIDYENETIEVILNNILKGTGLNYHVLDKDIVISTKGTANNDNTQQQQQKSVSGKVTDKSGASLPGVSVVIKGTTSGTITDADGNFSIANIPKNATLAFSFVGMKTQEVSMAGKTSIDVVLAEEAIGLDEVITVGYGTQRKGNLTGSIASVKSEKLTVAPIASVSNALAGQLPGLISKQTSGQPGYDQAAISIRGFGDALVIVDGIESSFNDIDVNQIESLSILKDGAASIYGARAGNGVILITTKRGVNQKPTITFNSSYTLQGVTKMLTPASSGQRSEMEREEWIQSGKPEATAPWKADEVAKFYAGTDPNYPNTNWGNEAFREWAPQQQTNMSVRGGSEKIKYYGFLGYTDQETMFKTNGGGYKRYNLQSNIDAQITRDLTATIDLSAAYELKHYPARDMQFMWQDQFSSKPYYPAHLPDPTKLAWSGSEIGSIVYTSNMDLSGYNNTDSKNIKGTITLNYNIRAVKGLSVKAFANYLDVYSTNKKFQKPGKFYTYNSATGTYTNSANFLANADLYQSYNTNSIFTQQYSIHYDNTINEAHHITALALYEAMDYKGNWFNASRRDYLTSAIDQLFAGSTSGLNNNGSASEMGRKSYVGRINYSYKNKYLLETIIRADASAKFSPDKHWGYFPSVSLGWVISQEGFMKNFSKLDNLKLRASYGQSGNDNVGNFQYLTGYRYGSTYLIGSSAPQGFSSTGMANPDLTWEKVKISNIGVDFSLFSRKLYGEADIFYRERSGIPATRVTTLPSTFGTSLPQENINSLNDRGFELNIGTAGKIGEVSYDLSGNISWSRAKWDHYEEPEYTDPDQARIYTNSGKWTDRVYGYLSDGLFTSQSQIDALTFDYPIANNALRPGDVRYKDVNKDGKLDWKDQVEIGMSTTPHWMYGINANLKYRNFDFSALFQGAFGYNVFVNLTNTWQSTARYELRWTEANNNPNALVTRLGGATTSNNLTSDYFYQKSRYLRLKTASLGYNIPKQWLNKIGFSQVRIYAAGTNLLTFSNLNKYGIDPETNNASSSFVQNYPQQRTISLGAQISF